MACNDDASHLSTSSSGCYPTGCPPCSEAIDFPADPKDGQRFCVPVGSMGETKCWVYDLCVPAWRAEGPSTSPTRYRGGVDIKTQKPGWEDTTNEIQAGDWYIQTKDESSPYQAEWGLSLGNTILSGVRLAYNGVSWQELEPANIPYAEEARDATPDPENRGGGIVKLASKEEVQAGTNKCNPITPYTLKEGIDGILDLPTFSPNSCEVAPAEGGPEQVAYWLADGGDDGAIGCKTLAEGSTNFKGVGKIANAFTNDTTAPGYGTDWLTNASMAPIINALIERIEQIENGANNGGGTGMSPIAQVNQVFEISENSGQSFTWTPIDHDNLQQIQIVLAGGIGGSAVRYVGANPEGGPFPQNPTSGTQTCPDLGQVPDVYRIFVSQGIPTSGQVYVGGGGRGGEVSAAFMGGSRCPEAGGWSRMSWNGFEAISAGGRAAFQQNYPNGIHGSGGAVTGCDIPDESGFPNTPNLTEIVTSQFPPRNATRDFQFWSANNQGQYFKSVAAPSPNGFVIVYEYYPTDWVDPRGNVRML